VQAKMGLPVKTRVLLLGSDSTFERNMVAALESESCGVILAHDCRQALDIIRFGHVDVLVLGLHIDSREFSHLASKCSLTARGCRTLVVADSLEQVALASESRVDGVLMKPLDANQLRTVIDNLLDGARTRALGERWRPDTSPVFKALPSRRDWGIDE
jgi:DNA-binding NtrC family response regulator